MSNVPITIASGDYDRTRAIRDGIVPVDGCEVTYLCMEAEELFFRSARYREFDVCEMSFAGYLMQRAQGKTTHIGIPIFPSRTFRHSAIFVRTDRGIHSPADLRGKIVGCPDYAMTAIVWARGLLADEYAVRPEDLRWRIGGQEDPGAGPRVPIVPPPGVEIETIPANKTLSAMLAEGELDAILVSRPPSCFTRGAAHVGRLFPDYRAVEQAYGRKTGLFPIMHLVGIRNDLAERYPWLPANLMKSFAAAKDLAMLDLQKVAALAISLPWIEAEYRATQDVLGADVWAYGANKNKKEIETICRYVFEQGLTSRLLTIQELFAPSTVQMAPA